MSAEHLASCVALFPGDTARRTVAKYRKVRAIERRLTSQRPCVCACATVHRDLPVCDGEAMPAVVASMFGRVTAVPAVERAAELCAPCAMAHVLRHGRAVHHLEPGDP